MFAPEKCIFIHTEDQETSGFRIKESSVPARKRCSYLGVVFNHLGIDLKATMEERTKATAKSIGLMGAIGMHGTGYATEANIRLHKAFKHSPSLKRYFLQEFADCYLNTRKLASAETGLAIATFPIESPFTVEQTLDEDFLPEG